MNAFYEHHQDSIRFGYRCFDRLLLNGLTQPFQQPATLNEIADQFQNWVKNRSEKWDAPVLEAPDE